MYLCRAASQTLASRLSRAPSAASRLKQRAPLRQMSSGSVPGSSGENMIYYLIAGVAAFGGLFYAYREVTSSRRKYIEHMNILHERAEGRKGRASSRRGDEEETDEVTEATEEAEAGAAARPPAEDESAGGSPETGGESEAPEASPAVEEAQQEVAANSEAAAVQAASDHEENTDSVEEGVTSEEGATSAAPEIPDPSPRSLDLDAEVLEQTSEGSVEEKPPEEAPKEP
ncbi:protein MGARP isoform X2 [Heliangelus exortis]|uniref:protein MGARP isoform X2 n=1 Tax=Heliangelus exortis TaxID=472823 RepID=UPI003A931104